MPSPFIIISPRCFDRFAPPHSDIVSRKTLTESWMNDDGMLLWRGLAGPREAKEGGGNDDGGGGVRSIYGPEQCQSPAERASAAVLCVRRA